MSRARAGQERIEGETYEYPYRVEDFDGNVVRGELDTIPPFLTQEEIDMLAVALTETPIQRVAVADALKKLPDSAAGRGEVPEDALIVCGVCGEVFDPDEAIYKQFDRFVHEECGEDE